LAKVKVKSKRLIRNRVPDLKPSQNSNAASFHNYTMDEIIDKHFERVEKALSTLINSISTYNPAPALANDLVSADAELSQGLEQCELLCTPSLSHTDHSSRYQHINPITPRFCPSVQPPTSSTPKSAKLSPSSPKPGASS